MEMLYEINGGTLFVKGISKNKCIIKEHSEERKEINGNARKVVDQSCINFGSTLEGRMRAVAALTGYKYKAPVLVSEYQRVIMFPTLSYKDDECAWIALDHVLTMQPTEKGVAVIFDDETIEEFNVSKYVIINQLAKAKGLYYNLFN